jgi:hypothetical protein
MHWHGVILHPDLRQSDLIDALKQNFPEDRQAYVEKNWHKNRSLMANIDRVIDYSLVADRHRSRPRVDLEIPMTKVEH